MTYQRQDGLMYRMPYGFGPTAGPRQGPDGRPFSWTTAPHRSSVAVSFLTDADQLSGLLPPGFSLVGEPVVTVELNMLTELEWLAGRGYSMLQVRFPAQFQGSHDHAIGSFLCVLWENLADPIISGREELGFAKLWCDLPPLRIMRDTVACSASWLSHEFLQLSAEDLIETDSVLPPYPGLEGHTSNGTLHYKYIPDTGVWGSAAVAHACLSPPAGKPEILRVRRGRGRVAFLPTTWEQMPTQFHIVAALAKLPQIENRDAWTVEARGGADLSNQRRLT